MKVRLDELLVSRGLASDLREARAYILAGRVSVNSQRENKAGSKFLSECQLALKGDKCRYVSRGGLKLEKGLDFFKISPRGLICADIGASTGGFTDCLLQQGASLVYAIDVGYGQLDWRLRQDRQVVVMERTNARNLTPGDLSNRIDLAVIDAAFISLKLLLPPLLPFFRDKNISIVALIKPQFEAAKEDVGKNGVICSPQIQQKVIDTISTFSRSIGLKNNGVTDSPILGPKGNKEFLIHLTS